MIKIVTLAIVVSKNTSTGTKKEEERGRKQRKDGIKNHVTNI